MLDQPPSLPLRAAVASLLGGLFGVALILATHSAQAQTLPGLAQPASTPSVMTVLDDRLKRLGEAALQALRGSEPVYGFSSAGARFARLNESAAEPEAGVRWQMTRPIPWRNESEAARNRDVLSLGVQVRF
jgi:hypothetical protein